MWAGGTACRMVHTRWGLGRVHRPAAAAHQLGSLATCTCLPLGPQLEACAQRVLRGAWAGFSSVVHGARLPKTDGARRARGQASILHPAAPPPPAPVGPCVTSARATRSPLAATHTYQCNVDEGRQHHGPACMHGAHTHVARARSAPTQGSTYPPAPGRLGWVPGQPPPIVHPCRRLLRCCARGGRAGRQFGWEPPTRLRAAPLWLGSPPTPRQRL